MTRLGRRIRWILNSLVAPSAQARNQMVEIIHKDLAYAINGCIFDVHNEVGPGVREESYQKGLELRLRNSGISFTAKPQTRCELIHRGEVADVFEPDLVISERVIAELKAQRDGLNRSNFMQTVNYLKFCDLRLGLLVNFAEAKAVIERVPFTPRPVSPLEDYSHIKPLLTTDLREQLVAVRESLLAIHRHYGIGYWHTTYRALVAIEFRHRGLSCRSDLIVTPELDCTKLPASPISPLLIGSDILVEVEALHEEITARAVRTMQSHLKLTDARIGLVVNFGKHSFEIRGVRPQTSADMSPTN